MNCPMCDNNLIIKSDDKGYLYYCNKCMYNGSVFYNPLTKNRKEKIKKINKIISKNK